SKDRLRAKLLPACLQPGTVCSVLDSIEPMSSAHHCMSKALSPGARERSFTWSCTGRSNLKLSSTSKAWPATRAGPPTKWSCRQPGRRPALGRPEVVTLRRRVVPNIGRQLVFERCVHGVAEQFESRIRPEGNRALHNQSLLVVHDDLQALELVAIHRSHPA